MCFNFKNKARTVTSHFYISLTGKRYFLFCAKKVDRILIIELENNEGDIIFSLENRNSGRKQELINSPTGSYEFKLNKGEKYRLVISATKASGSHKIKIKNV